MAKLNCKIMEFTLINYTAKCKLAHYFNLHLFQINLNKIVYYKLVALRKLFAIFVNYIFVHT